jgi:hypothetical protein
MRPWGGIPPSLRRSRGWACSTLPRCPTTHRSGGNGRSQRCPRGWGGRKPTRARVVDGALAAQTVVAVAEGLPAERWSRQTIKEGSKGPLVADCAAVRVIAMREGVPGPEVWLVLRRNVQTGELKTYVSNAPVDTSLATLVRLSGMRWPIETCFEDGKQYLEMGDYEVRSWRGWHHHMTLCILAHGFLVADAPPA